MLNSNEENSWLEQYEFVQEASYKRAVDLYAMCEVSNRLHQDLDRFFPRHYALEAVHFGRNLDKDPFEIATDLENAVQKKIAERKYLETLTILFYFVMNLILNFVIGILLQHGLKYY